MTDLSEDQLNAIFAVAIRNAIQEMGMERFKQLSFFGSNERLSNSRKQAA